MNRIKHNAKYLLETLATISKLNSLNLRNNIRPEGQERLIRLNPRLAHNAIIAMDNHISCKIKNKPVIYKNVASNFSLVRDKSVDQIIDFIGDHAHENGTIRSCFYGNKSIKFFPIFQASPEILGLIDLKWFYETVKPKPAIDQGFQFFASKQKGGVTHFHNANDSNLFCQISGKKRWIIFDSRYSHLFRPAVSKGEYRIPKGEILQSIDIFEGLITSELHDIPYFDITLEPGDVLYVPPFAWHTVKNISDNSLAFGYRWLSPMQCFLTSPFYSLLDCFAVDPPIWKSIFMARKDFRQLFLHQSEQKVLLKKLYNKRSSLLANNYAIYLSATRRLMRNNHIY